MSDPRFAIGSFGSLIEILQQALQRASAYSGRIDGDFGVGTQEATSRFQGNQHGLRVTGQADSQTWERATGFDWPSLFERCLQLTARFEGNGYQKIEGNFDGAGLTWGIIGFTLDNGEIQALVHEVLARDPTILRAAFGDKTDELLALFARNDADELMQFADSLSIGTNKAGVSEPWRSAFQTLGHAPLMQQLQRDRARRRYFDPSQQTAAELGLSGDLGAALAFDIHVQNGGIKVATQQALDQWMDDNGGASAKDRRMEVAELVAASANKKWRADVLARKSAIASGAGDVHGLHIRTSDWGLADDS
jgi:Putative peptidoglycan binding domain/Glycosyl hydrolase family 46